MRTTTWTVVPYAVLVFVLALLSPVEAVDSDPAISLLAAQALLDHGTLNLDVYSDEPECAYDLTADYRVKRWRGSYYYYSFGTPVLSAPAVWMANRLGFHMLRQDDEFATQNLLSALACVLIFVLIHRLCRYYVEPVPSLLIAVVSTFGSSLMSTLATGLWNTDLALVLICLALVHLAEREERPPAYSYLFSLLMLAFLCRPSSAIFAVALVASRLHYNRRSVLRTSVVLALLLALGLAMHQLAALEWVPRYYGVRRLVPEYFVAGLGAALTSPSRGLLVFSPFLVPVIAACIVRSSRLWSSPMYRLALVWILLFLPALALKIGWWKGHSYGPRLTTELMPAFVLITVLLWRGWVRGGLPASARFVAVAYLVLAVPAIAIHSGQGLFNPAVRRWNEEPNIDFHPQALFDWRFPQFLATDSMVDERRLVLEPPVLVPYRAGDPILYDDEGVIFTGWYMPETEFRWTQGEQAELVILIEDIVAERPYLLEMRAGALGRQRFTLSVNGGAVGAFELDGLEPQEAILLLAPGRLAAGENRLQLGVPRPSSTDEDRRRLGLALRSLRLFPMSSDLPEVGFPDQGYLTMGFSGAEQGWRWTASRHARIAYPVGSVDPFASYVLHLTAGALGHQTVHIRLNGRGLGSLDFEGFEAATRSLTVPARALRPFSLQELHLEIPGATETTSDPRLLGLAFVGLRLEEAVPQPDAEGGASERNSSHQSRPR